MIKSTFNVDAYLRRIGLEGSFSPTVENLKILTRAHLEAVPFENLQLFSEHGEPALDAQGLFTKIVENHRGGYCFELNKAFCLLLQALGFDCYCVATRIVYHRPEPARISHRAVVVNVDGEKWFCDVGYGGAGPKGALSMSTSEIQIVYGDSFRIIPEGLNHVLVRIEGELEERVMVYRDESWPDCDFEVINAFYSIYPSSVFRNTRILYRCTKDGWINLRGTTFTVCSNGNVTVEELDESQIPELVKTRFDLLCSCTSYSENKI